MTKWQAHYFSLVVLLLLFVSSAVSFARFNSSPQQDAKPNSFAGDLALKGLADYRQWARVNEKPKPSNNFQLDFSGG